MENIIMYEGVSLSSYCQKHNICYRSKLRMIKKRMQTDKDSSLNEIISNVMQTSRVVYYFDNMKLKDYCELHNINYDTILKRISRLKRQEPNLSNDELSALALAQNAWIKYYYGDETLSSYCQKRNFDINNVTDRIRNIMKKNPTLSLEDVINETVQYYEQKRFWENVLKIFAFLKNAPVDDKNIPRILDYLNISHESFKTLINKHRFNALEAITLIWYFHDSEKQEKLSISNNKLKKILLYIKSLRDNTFGKIEDLDVAYLFGIYKTGLFDTRYLILLREENFIYHTVYKTQNDFSLCLKKSDIDDICDEVKVKLLEILEKISSNIHGNIISYIIKSIYGYVTDYFINLKNNMKTTSLENNSDDKDKIAPIDVIPANSNNSNGNYFSEDTLDFLDGFGKRTKDFIVYKYQENQSYESIAKIFGMSVDEVITFERKLLLELRNNPAIKEFFGICSR